jgi:hypothetical protein
MATDSTGQIIRASKGAERVGSWLNGHLDQSATWISSRWRCPEGMLGR